MAAAALCPAQQEAHQLRGMSPDVTDWMLQDVQQGSLVWKAFLVLSLYTELRITCLAYPPNLTCCS